MDKFIGKAVFDVESPVDFNACYNGRKEDKWKTTLPERLLDAINDWIKTAKDKEFILRNGHPGSLMFVVT